MCFDPNAERDAASQSPIVDAHIVLGMRLRVQDGVVCAGMVVKIQMETCLRHECQRNANAYREDYTRASPFERVSSPQWYRCSY